MEAGMLTHFSARTNGCKDLWGNKLGKAFSLSVFPAELLLKPLSPCLWVIGWLEKVATMKTWAGMSLFIT